MCDPVSIITSVVGAVVQGAMKKEPKAPEAPTLAKPPQAQASRMADQSAARRGSDSGGGALAGPASTMLTGNSGVATDSLNLGKNQLLGA